MWFDSDSHLHVPLQLHLKVDTAIFDILGSCLHTTVMAYTCLMFTVSVSSQAGGINMQHMHAQYLIYKGWLSVLVAYRI